MKQLFECSDCGILQHFLYMKSAILAGWIGDVCGECTKKNNVELQKVKNNSSRPKRILKKCDSQA